MPVEIEGIADYLKLLDNGTPLQKWLTYEEDPFIFAAHALRLDADLSTKQLMESTAEETLILASRQTGKTTGMAARACQQALFNDGTLALIVSATQRQAGILQSRSSSFLLKLRNKHKWSTVKHVEVPSDPLDENSRMVRSSVLALELANGSQIVSVPASPDTVRGYSPHLIICDEAAFIPDTVYEAIRPMRAATKAHIIAASSAGSERGWFYNEWISEDPEWQRLEWLADNCERVTMDFLNREREKLPDAIFKREYMNVFMPPLGSIITGETRKMMFSTDVKARMLPFQTTNTIPGLRDPNVKARPNPFD